MVEIFSLIKKSPISKEIAKLVVTNQFRKKRRVLDFLLMSMALSP
jgi:hypothetical protein